VLAVPLIRQRHSEALPHHEKSQAIDIRVVRVCGQPKTEMLEGCLKQST